MPDLPGPRLDRSRSRLVGAPGNEKTGAPTHPFDLDLHGLAEALKRPCPTSPSSACIACRCGAESRPHLPSAACAEHWDENHDSCGAWKNSRSCRTSSPFRKHHISRPWRGPLQRNTQGATQRVRDRGLARASTINSRFAQFPPPRGRKSGVACWTTPFQATILAYWRCRDHGIWIDRCHGSKAVHRHRYRVDRRQRPFPDRSSSAPLHIRSGFTAGKCSVCQSTPRTPQRSPADA